MKAAAKKMKQRSAGKPDIELGKRIRLRRVEQKISQAELGDKLGVSFQQVQKYEKGVNRVGAARLQSIATALDVPVTFFYDGDGKAREVDSLPFLDSASSLAICSCWNTARSRLPFSVSWCPSMELIAANEDERLAASGRSARGHDRSEIGRSLPRRQRICWSRHDGTSSCHRKWQFGAVRRRASSAVYAGRPLLQPLDRSST